MSTTNRQPYSCLYFQIFVDQFRFNVAAFILKSVSHVSKINSITVNHLLHVQSFAETLVVINNASRLLFYQPVHILRQSELIVIADECLYMR